MKPPIYTGPARSETKVVDGKLNSPASARNLDPILGVLRQHFPKTGTALELASGSGQHVAAFAGEFPDVQWQPTDVEPDRLASIEAWSAASGHSNINPPLTLNVADNEWPVPPESKDATLTVNLLHLVSEAVANALFAGITRTLRTGGKAFIYGPFTRGGSFVSDGDRSFHQSLQRMDPAIGYKDQDWINARIAYAGLKPTHWVDMPANNLMLIAEKTS